MLSAYILAFGVSSRSSVRKIFFTGTGRHICDFLLHNARIRGRIMQYKKIQEVKFVAEH